MAEVFFSADHHFGHERILELCDRPFADVAQMNERIIELHNERVRPRDVVWLLGDLCMGPIGESLAAAKRLNGRKYLISGNHDRTWVGYYPDRPDKIQDWARRYREEAGITAVITGGGFHRPGNGSLRQGLALPLGLGIGTVRAWHFPAFGDSHGEDRYVDWRPRMKAGAWLVHGHTHAGQPTGEAPRHINVGVDAWDYAPVHIEEIRDIIRDSS